MEIQSGGRRPVLCGEGHSTILLVHTRIFTRLIMILKGAHDYMRPWAPDIDA